MPSPEWVLGFLSCTAVQVLVYMATGWSIPRAVQTLLKKRFG